MSSRTPPHWQLPRGVPRGVWEYAHAENVAQEYDDDLTGHPLFDFDEEVLNKHLVKPGTVVDFGCGTGRATIQLARRGFSVLAVDLSPAMLEIVGRKAEQENLAPLVRRVRANLVELDCLADGAADCGVSLFSTLGMIRGRDNRQKALEHARRIIRTGGTFILHAHNLWHNVWNPLGRSWIVRHAWDALWRKDVELGDKFFDYRGVPQVFVHAFPRRELTRAIREAGFRIRELITLDVRGDRSLRMPWLAGRLRAYGWIAICE